MRLRSIFTAAMIMLVSFTGLLAGCGGAGNPVAPQTGGSSTAAAQSGASGASTGAVQMVVQYAASGASKSVPADTATLRIHVVSLTTGQDLVPPVIQEHTPGVGRQTVTIGGIPPGTVRVIVETLDASGAVTGISANAVVVQAGATTAEIVSQVQSVVSFAVAPSTTTVAAGSSTHLTAIATLSDGSTLDITSLATWSSGNAAIASVSDTSGTMGVVTAVSPGSTSISATYNGITSSAFVGVGGGTPLPTPSPVPSATPSPTSSPTPSPTSSPTPSPAPSSTPAPSTINVTHADLNAFKQLRNGNQFNGVAFKPAAPTVTVYVGDYGTIATSDSNGLVFRSSATLSTLNAVAWLDAPVSLFAAVGENGTIVTSPDGFTWTPRTSPVAVNYNDIVAGNGGFVAVGDSDGATGAVVSSTNGIDWSDISFANNDVNYTGVAFGKPDPTHNGFFEVVSSSAANGALYCQTADNTLPANGAAWTRADLNQPMRAVAFVRSNTTGSFVAVGNTGNFESNTDGTSWAHSAKVTGNPNLTGIAYGKVNGIDTLVAVAGGGRVVFDSGAIPPTAAGDWTDGTATFATPGMPTYDRDMTDVRFFNNEFTAVGAESSVLTSPTGTAYTVLNYTPFIDILGMVTGQVGGQPLYVAVGSATDQGRAFIETSRDAITWTPADSNVGPLLTAVTFGDGRFVAIGLAGEVTQSTDGRTWTAATAPPTQTYAGICAGAVGTQTMFVAVADSNYIATSSDGNVWTETNNKVTADMNAVAYARAGATPTDTFVAVADNGLIVWSHDLVNWTTASVSGSPTDDLQGVCYSGGLFVAVGANGRILTSSDGMTWANKGSVGADSLSAVVGVTTPSGSSAFVGFIAVGEHGAIYRSTDPAAATWTVTHSTSTTGLDAVTVGVTQTSTLDILTNVTTNTFNVQFVAGGEMGTVLNSP